MEAIDQILMERYLANEMTAAERIEFERRVELDKSLQMELAEYKLAMEAITLAQREELKDRFRQRDKTLDRKNSNNPLGHSRNLWLLSAAAVLAIIIGWRFFMFPTQTPDQTDGLPKDTIITEQKLPLRQDTLQTNEPKDDKKEEVKPTKPKVNAKELYAANFESYKDESMNLTSRADEDDLTAYEKFQLWYWQGKEGEALDEFKKLSPSLQQNDNLRFFQANALMAVNRTDEAAPILAEVIKNQKSGYKTEALYYLALCDVKNGNFEQARKKLKDYIENHEALQINKANKILAELN